MKREEESPRTCPLVLSDVLQNIQERTEKIWHVLSHVFLIVLAPCTLSSGASQWGDLCCPEKDHSAGLGSWSDCCRQAMLMPQAEADRLL